MVGLFDDGVAYVPVPASLYAEAMHFIAGKLEQVNAGGLEATQNSSNSSVNKNTTAREELAWRNVPDWSEEELRRLLLLINPHNRLAMAVLDMTAATPVELVAFPDACKKAGVSGAGGRAGMGALTKVCKKLGKNLWPVSSRWAEGGEICAYYQMSTTTAERWHRVRLQNP